MRRGPKAQRRPPDVVANAICIMDIATGHRDESYDRAEDGKDEAAAELGRTRGKARAERMTDEDRTEAARKAAVKRWKN